VEGRSADRAARKVLNMTQSAKEIARYELADAARRLRREAKYRMDLTLDEFTELFEAPAEDLDRTTLAIDRHLSGLPQGQQAVVRALAVEGASVRSTAERLQTSEGAVQGLCCKSWTGPQEGCRRGHRCG
jgi:DNA-directed RNA polymerase specialized sigma24 family protein